MAGPEDRPKSSSSLKDEHDGLRKLRLIDDLHKAAKSGDVDGVTNYDEDEVDIDAANSKGLTALHLACREGNFDVVVELLRKGANIQATTKKLNSPLHVASLGGKLDIVKKLLEYKAEVNRAAENGMTPLYMAAQENHIDVAKELLQHNADPHLSASGGFEPVDVAIQQKHPEMTAFLMEQGSKRGFKALHVIARKDACNAAALLLSNGYDANVTAPNGYTPLHIAAKYGSINTALILIESSANVNAIAKHNITPLHVASKHGQTEVVSLLIEAGTDLDVATKDGLTALHCAARDGHEHCVELLLVHNASMNAKTRHGLTALHMAAQGNHVNCANHLLGHGCHIDSPTSEGVSPLHVAAHYGNLSIAQLLLDRGADVDKRAKNGYTALHVACKKNREDIVQLLIKYGANVHLKNLHGQTALHLSAFFGMVNIVLILIQNEASIEETTIREETSLHIACRTKQINVARLLLRNDARIDPRSKMEETPLLIACRQNSPEIVSLLLDHEADPDARNKDESTCLHIASRNGNIAIIESLLDHGAKIDLRNRQLCTALHEAARRGHTDIARMLLEKNADVNAEAKNNLRPLHMSCHYRHLDVSVLLMANGAELQATAKNGFTPMHIVSKNNAIELAFQLLASGIDADKTTRTGISPLHLTAKEGNVKIADALLENGASPGIQTKNGLTPLHIVARYNQEEVAKKLIKYAAPINSQTANGYTPLHIACFYGHGEIAKLLLEDGADVEAKTRNANTPLHIAALRGHSLVAELLLKYNAPANTLNKDGYTSLYIAEVTHHTAIVETLMKVTHVVIRKRDEGVEDKVKLTYSAPEELEEAQLIEAADESDIEASKERLAVNEDFEENFLGFEESGIREPGNESITSNRTAESVENLINDSVISESPVFSEETTTVFETPPPGILLTSESNDRVDNIMELEPPITGGFLISFVVDARGGIFESRQTGIRVTIPRGACSMPTRITCKLLRNNRKILMPKLYINEGLVSRVVELAPQGIQFLKPVIIEVPHFGSLRKRERELIVLRQDPDSDFWREHVSTRMHSDVNEMDGFTEMPTSPEHGFKSGTQFVRISTQDFPERFAVIARPRKEKFLMSPEGGVIKSGVLSKAQVIFSENTLNLNTKIVLQLQLMDESLLQPEETARFSSLIRLEPHIKLVNPVTVLIPCPWITSDQSYGVSSSLRLMALMPESDNEMHQNSEWSWKDVTDLCSVTASENCCRFQTTFLTTYWIIENEQPEKIPVKAEILYPLLSSLPFLVKFLIFGRVLDTSTAELRVFCVSDDKTEKSLEKSQGFVEIARSRDIEVYGDQELLLQCAGASLLSSKALKIRFRPFRENRLAFKVDGVSSTGPWSYRVAFISSLNQDANGRVPSLCCLDAVLPENMVKNKVTVPTGFSRHQVGDDLLQMISKNIGDSWKELAKRLHMSNSDIQGVADLSSYQHVLAALTMLELWRSTKGEDANVENLRNAVETIGRGDLCELFEGRSPTTLAPRGSHPGSVERFANEGIDFNDVLTSEKRESSSDIVHFEFSDTETVNNTKNEPKQQLSSMERVVPPVDFDLLVESPVDEIPSESPFEGRPPVDDASVNANNSEEPIAEQSFFVKNPEINFDELRNHTSQEEEFVGSYEPQKSEECTQKDDICPREEDSPINSPDDKGIYLELNREPCKEDSFQESRVSDVHCRMSKDEFLFMESVEQKTTDKSGISPNGDAKKSSFRVGEKDASFADENSNLNVTINSEVDKQDVILTNGDAHDDHDSVESEDVIKKMFAGEQSVLAFFDAPTKVTED